MAGVLEPSRAGKTAVVLTSRMVRKLQYGREEITEERELSIHDGSMERVKFEEVDQLLDVTHKPILPRNAHISTKTPSLEELNEDLENRL